ncbi:hypothetical protein [Pseudoalteromonas aurantia]|uniref:Uncharacterized protein n=1 Tax=Pseudoalteromonas aurantia TaxID=43654 RepID=A0A5S3VDL9_9GAMM|nr:hypothetical protein [Pseudoalteromonas aurantia]TMO60634.1 hypothetical protein CWC18_13310 [Pseudoalteromonas aurantia]TMO70071.1 hypothetical protein CWC19_02465 [Pseudoalteromonas aurantia]TMO76097.1 hypothetical protein CWC20_06235 [Pseudoalteromonas aurantia]
MYDIYTIADHAHPFIVALGLLFSWKVPTARWFLLCYFFVILFNIAVLPITIQWNTHYYISEALINIVFIFPILYRKDLALFFYSKTGMEFYRQVYEKQRLSSQECLIVLMFLLAVVVNLITWFEVLAYKYYWIDNAYFKLYFRDNIILFILLALLGCLLTYTIKAKSRELNYENTK